MTRFVAPFLLLFWSNAVIADPIRVLSAEHGHFTRLIFEFETRPRWELTKRGIGYRLTLRDTPPHSFDLSRVFRLIDRARLRDIRPFGESAIDIDLACECEILTNETGGQVLVLDIQAIDAQPQTPLVNVGSLPFPDIEQHPMLPKSNSQSPSAPLFSFTPEVVTTSTAGLNGQAMLPELFRALEASESAAVTLVARALSRAAAQGLVTANSEPGVLLPFPETTSRPNLFSRGNLSVSTGFDRVLPSNAAAISPPGEGNVCISDARVDVAVWGDAKDVASLGRLRTEAIAEDGGIETDGAIALAKYYLHLGFGAEARLSTLHISPSSERDIIQAIADIMDKGSTNSGVFEGQLSCDGIVSLWAALSQPISLRMMPESTNALLAAFSALPSHLRSHLGPLLSERLYGVGLSQGARSAINAVTRGGVRTDESELAGARLELDGNHSEKARDTLSELSYGTDATAAAALLELLKDAEKREMAPNPVWVEDVPTLVGALEGIEIADRLNIAGLKGLIALGRYGEFRRSISRTSPGVTDNVRLELAKRAMGHVLKHGSDLDFISNELALSQLVDADAHPKSKRVAFAERLESLGLASRALIYLSGTPESIIELEIRTRALSATGQLQQALSMIANSGIEGAPALIGDVLLKSGRSDAAIDAYFDAGRVNDAHAVALRSGAWDWMTDMGSDEISNAIEQLSTAMNSPESEAPNGALIKKTRLRQEQFRELLRLTQPSQTLGAFTN